MGTAAIIVTYNARQWITRCIESVLASTAKPSIIVIDNSSSDGTADFIAATWPSVDVIRLEKNVGFGRTNNVGIAKACQAGVQFLFLLNQDAWVWPTCIQTCIDAADDEAFGVLSPVQCDYDGKAIHDGFRRYLRDEGIELQEPLGSGGVTQNVSFLPAALWLLRSSVIDRVGGSDPSFFLYGEDSEFAARVRHTGLKVGLVSGALGGHREGGRTVDHVRISRQRYGQYVRFLKFTPLSILLRWGVIAWQQMRRIVRGVVAGKTADIKASIRTTGMLIWNLTSIERSRRDFQILARTKQGGIAQLNARSRNDLLLIREQQTFIPIC